MLNQGFPVVLYLTVKFWTRLAMSRSIRQVFPFPYLGNGEDAARLSKS